jgi:hypothetical protein
MSDVTEFKRDHYYQALREYGLPHHLAETIVDEFGHACGAMVVGAQINEQLRAEVGRLKAELAALDARRCETCRHVYHSELIPTRWVCVRLNENFEVLPDSDFCSRWQDKEAADA